MFFGLLFLPVVWKTGKKWRRHFHHSYEKKKINWSLERKNSRTLTLARQKKSYSFVSGQFQFSNSTGVFFNFIIKETFLVDLTLIVIICPLRNKVKKPRRGNWHFLLENVPLHLNYLSSWNSTSKFSFALQQFFEKLGNLFVNS